MFDLYINLIGVDFFFLFYKEWCNFEAFSMLYCVYIFLIIYLVKFVRSLLIILCINYFKFDIW